MNIAITTIVTLAVIMISVAMITYVERKLLAAFQLRKGPSIVGPIGLFQPIADCVKLLCKQIIWPKNISKTIFCLPPFISILFTLVCFLYVPIPFVGAIIKCDYSAIIVVCLSTLSALGECLPGLISDSKYQKYGAYRAMMQILSYELCIVLCVINVCIVSDSYDLSAIMENNNLLLIHVLVIYIASSLAEGNRTPFDVLEAEQELIAGYHTEYSGILFCIFYINEYANILLSSLLTSAMFFKLNTVTLVGNCSYIFCTILMIFFIIITRAVLPRYSFNDVIKLFWKRLIPILLLSVLIIMFGTWSKYVELL